MANGDPLLAGAETDPLLAGAIAEEEIVAPTGIEQVLFPELKTSLKAPAPEAQPVTLPGGPGAVPTGFATLTRPEAVTTPLAPIISGLESFPKRLLATLRGGDLTDPNAAFFGPKGGILPDVLSIEAQEEGAVRLDAERKVIEDKIAAEGREATPEETEQIRNLQEGATSRRTIAQGLELASDPLLPLSLAKSAIKKIGRGAVGIVSGNFGKIKQSLTQLSDETLKAIGGRSGKGITNLEKAKDVAPKLGQQLEEFFINPAFPEEDVIKAALPKVRKIDLKPVADAIDDAKVKGRFSADINTKLDALKDELVKDPATGFITKSLSAEEYLATRRNLDNAVGRAFDQDVPPQIKKKMINIASTMRKGIRKAAIDSKQPQIVEKLGTMHDKFDAMDKIRRSVNNNSESFVLNLFGKGKTSQQEALKQLEKLFKGDKRLEGAFNLAKMRKLGEKLDANDFKAKGFAARGEGITRLGGPLVSPRLLNLISEAGGITTEIFTALTKAGLTAAQIAAISNALTTVGGEVAETITAPTQLLPEEQIPR